MLIILFYFANIHSSLSQEDLIPLLTPVEYPLGFADDVPFGG